MRFLLIAIGLAGLLFLFVVAVPSHQLTALPPSLEGAAGIPLSERAKDLLEQTKSAALQLVDRQRRWERISIYLGFAGLGLTALATLYAGWKSSESRAGKEEFLNKKIMAIGALTAFATLAAGSSDLVDRVGVKPVEGDVAALKKALTDVPAEIAAEPEAEASILDALEVTLAEHRP